MFDDDDGQPALRESSDQRHRLIDLGWIKPGHDFVEQQEPGLRRQRARHLEPALIDGGQILRGGVLFGRQADELDRLTGLFARCDNMPVAQERAGHDVGEHRHGAERFCHLEGAHQTMRADVVRFQAHDLFAEGQDRTLVGPVKAGDEMKTCGLAGAVRPDQGERFVFLHRKADVLNGAQAPKPLAEAANNERVCHRMPITPAPVCG